MKIILIILLSINLLFANNIKLTKDELHYLKEHPVIKVHNEMDWAPYNYNTDGNPSGFSIDYIKLLASKIGLKINFIYGYSWNQFLNLIKNNKIDLMLNIAKTKEREKYLAYTSPYFQAIDSLATKKENKQYKKLIDLNGKTVAVVKGFYEEYLLKKYYPDIKIKTYKTTLETLKALSFGKVDATIDNIGVINYFINKYSITNIEPIFEIDDIRFNLDLHMATNKNNQILRNILEKAKKQITPQEIISLEKKWLGNNNINNKYKIHFTQKELEYISNKKKITMCIDPHWLPFEEFDKNGKYHGISKDFFNIFEKQIGIKIEPIHTYTWAQSIEFAKKRKCDILSLAMETESRKKYMNFTQPYLKIPFVIATKFDITYISDITQLKGKKIGIIKGYASAELLRKKYKNITIVDVISMDDGLDKVSNGDLFGFIDTLASISYKLQSKYMGEIKIAGELKENWELGIGVRNDDPILLNIFQKTINNLDNDTQNAIINKWLMAPQAKVIDYKYLKEILTIFILFILVSLYWMNKLSKANKKINESLRKAQMATRTKSEFLANMSHEIRTPMNGIIGMTQLVLQTNLDEKQKHYMNQIDNSAANLLNIINDILDFSKIEAGKLTIDKIHFNMSDLLEDIKNISIIKAQEKGLEFILDYKCSKENICYGDNLRIRQVLINLIGNSIKFTNKGFVHVNVKRENNTTVNFEISDSGIGISQEQQTKLFKSFSQADGSITRKYGGTGLGLSISKQFVELMGGKIWVESEVDKGSKFIFELPLEVGNITKIKKKNTSPVNIKNLKGSNILLVEDNNINQEIILGILEHSGINIDIASNGLEALNIFQNNISKYELILMDLQMPIMDGYEATKQIRKIDKNIPIIALTANAMKEDIEKTKKITMNEHLSKPIKIDKLHEILIKYISKKENYNKEIILDKDKENISIPKFQYIDTSLGLLHMANNKKLYLNILNEFYTKYKNLQLENMDNKELKLTLHTIKGLSANIGATNLNKIVIELEINLDKTLYSKFYRELNNILNDLKLLDLKTIVIESNLILTDKKRADLFNNLKNYAIKRRSKQLKEIVEELHKYKLSQKDKNILDKISLLVNAREYKNIVELI